MSCEDGRDIYPPLLGQWYGYSSQPLMELGDDGFFLLMVDILDNYQLLDM